MPIKCMKAQVRSSFSLQTTPVVVSVADVDFSPQDLSFVAGNSAYSWVVGRSLDKWYG